MSILFTIGTYSYVFIGPIRTAGAIILEIIYGYQVQETNDPFVALADRATEQFSVGSMPAKFAVNLIPQCAPNFIVTMSYINPDCLSGSHSGVVPWGRVQEDCSRMGHYT